MPQTISPRPRISLLVSDLSRQGAGRWGGAVRTFLLADALDRLGYPVQIAGFAFGELPDKGAIDRWPLTVVPGRNYPSFVAAARDLCRQLDGELLYAIKLKPTSFGVALADRRFTGRPVLLDIDDWEMSWHGGDGWRYRPSPRQLARDLLKPDGQLRQPDHPFYLQRIEGWVSAADAVTTHARALQARFGGHRVPNGKNVERFDPSRYDRDAAREKYGFAGYRVLAFPGAPRPYKGVEDILAAIAALDWPDLRLAIVGGSPYDDYDRALAERWGRWILAIPPQPPAAMPEIVAAADAVVVPQRDTPETRAQFPLKLTDGMAMAKPIIATRVGDIPEILGDTGYLAEPSAPDQLADCIRAAFADPETARQRGLAARDRCVRHYSLDAMARALGEVLAGVLEESAPPDRRPSPVGAIGADGAGPPPKNSG